MFWSEIGSGFGEPGGTPEFREVPLRASSLPRRKENEEKNALCHNKSALNNFAFCMTLLLLLSMGSLIHMH